jgi:glycosyltransferase involved in cell wall biosynthesis
VVSIPLRSYGLNLAQNYSPGLRRRLSKPSFDVLLEDELAHPSLFRLNRSLAPPRVGIVHHLRSSEERAAWQNDFYRKVEKRYLQSLDAFVFNSETTKETVESLLGKKTRNVVAPPGGDRLPRSITADEVARRAAAPGELRILFVGNLIPRKGLHTLLTALHSLEGRSFRLDVVGREDADRGYAASIRRQAAELGLTDRIHFHGALTGAALEEEFRAAHLLAVPSSYEGFGIVYLEAMGFGLPVIASASGASDEIVRHESTGFLVPPGDSWSLARRLESLDEDRALLSRMSVAAFEAFEDHPGWEASMRQVEGFLLDLQRRR